MINLTEVSMKHRTLVWYFIIIAAIGGIFSYIQLGRMEDPQFTIRQMVISAAWPGATAEEMQNQVTDKMEKKFQDIPGLNNIKSETRAGQTVIYVSLKDDVDKNQIRPTWRDLRNFGEDLKKDLPDGVYGPYYNDRFDDVYGAIYAVTGDGYDYEEMRQYAEKTRRMLLNVPSVQKVELIGEQEEKVYVEVENAKLAELGISPAAISSALKKQNEMTAAPKVETESDNVYLRVSGTFGDVDAIRAVPINANGRIFRLGDIATVERRFEDPAKPKMYFNGEPAIGIAVSMEDGGNILKLGENLKHQIDSIQQEVPVGIDIHKVSDQPSVVDGAIHDFVETLIGAAERPFRLLGIGTVGGASEPGAAEGEPLPAAMSQRDALSALLWSGREALPVVGADGRLAFTVKAPRLAKHPQLDTLAIDAAPVTSLRTGAVVGVAAPVIVHLGYEPADKALIEQHVKITTTPAVEGRTRRSWARARAISSSTE